MHGWYSLHSYLCQVAQYGYLTLLSTDPDNLIHNFKFPYLRIVFAENIRGKYGVV